MKFQELLSDKTIKPKEKTEMLSKWILENPLKINELIDFSRTSKDPVKATCIESFEFATKQNPGIASEALLTYASASLTEKAPRIKWESAKVVGNIAHLFPTKLDTTINNLLVNTEHTGTVVRWSAAFALGEILKLKTPHNRTLTPAIMAICEREEKNSIRKIYLVALKIAGK